MRVLQDKVCAARVPLSPKILDTDFVVRQCEPTPFADIESAKQFLSYVIVLWTHRLAAELVLDETGRSFDEWFSNFDRTPIGVASLAQVHRATLRETGEEVAVKIQHARLREFVDVDMKVSSRTCRVTSPLN